MSPASRLGVFGRIAFLAASAFASAAFADPVFLYGGATITHTGNLGGGSGDQVVTTIGTIPQFSSTAYQYQATGSSAITNGSASSTARAGIGWVTSPNFMGLSFPTGTNLTQRGNSNRDPSTASTLRIDFSATFRIDGSAFTSSTAGASFGLLGNIPTGGTAFAELVVNAQFDYTPPNSEGSVVLRSPITPTPFFSRTAPGSFTFSRNDSTATNPTRLEVGGFVDITGYIQFRVHNDIEQSTLELGDDASLFAATAVPTPAAALSGALSLAGLGLCTIRRRRV